mmetsp:Transcript_20620/g.34544  ORF Transcript_20620/g.34544 Transcript_20620/m.34544 type:complete len:143 (+) Transcript_20620:55-483(+)
MAESSASATASSSSTNTSSQAQAEARTTNQLPKRFTEQLNDFLAAVESYNPTVPEAISSYYLKKSGCDIKDDRIPKVVSLAADKLLSEIVHEAKQISILRQQSVRSNKRKTEMAETLEMVDIEASLAQAKVFLRRKRQKGDD